MDVTSFNRLGSAVACAATLLACPLPDAWAGGAGHGGVPMRASGAVPGWHAASGAMRPSAVSMPARMGSRGLPPLSGIIHERPGMRPYLSRYGHTGTAAGFPGPGGVARGGFALGGYGHTATGLRGFASARSGAAGFGRSRAFPERFRLARAGGRFIGTFGGAGLGYRFAGGYGGVPYGGWSPGGGAGYGADGTYGGSSTETQVGSYGGTYRSETPLAASFAEPPLAPSPGSGYDTSNRYAYAASDDAPPAARIVSVYRPARRDCDCGPRTRPEPIIYRYGVGTAY